MEKLRSSQYSRSAAVDYAQRYALKPNPNYRYFSLSNTGGDCSNFLSQCLSAGGAKMNSNWWYKHIDDSTHNDTWSISWAVAHSLYWYLKKNEAEGTSTLKGLEVDNANLLELGDLIFYEDFNGRIFHSAIVTFKSTNEILISQHSYEALNISYFKSWPSKKFHFIKVRL
jgi:hypothetical protein